VTKIKNVNNVFFTSMLFGPLRRVWTGCTWRLSRTFFRKAPRGTTASTRGSSVELMTPPTSLSTSESRWTCDTTAKYIGNSSTTMRVTRRRYSSSALSRPATVSVAHRCKQRRKRAQLSKHKQLPYSSVACYDTRPAKWKRGGYLQSYWRRCSVYSQDVGLSLAYLTLTYAWSTVDKWPLCG